MSPSKALIARLFSLPLWTIQWLQWLFSLKRNADISASTRKARSCQHSWRQEHGDYSILFSPLTCVGRSSVHGNRLYSLLTLSNSNQLAPMLPSKVSTSPPTNLHEELIRFTCVITTASNRSCSSRNTLKHLKR